MSIKKINVIDLDKTLIPYDTFRKFILYRIVRFDLYLIYYTILRLFRIISLNNYKKKITLYLIGLFCDQKIDLFVTLLLKDVDHRVLDIIKNETDKNTLNILLSASPDIYVKKIANNFGWVGQGSFFDNNNFNHIFGLEKINWLLNNYNLNDYKYNFAISDSKSDYKLLKYFFKNKIWNSNIK